AYRAPVGRDGGDDGGSGGDPEPDEPVGARQQLRLRDELLRVHAARLSDRSISYTAAMHSTDADHVQADAASAATEPAAVRRLTSPRYGTIASATADDSRSTSRPPPAARSVGTAPTGVATTANPHAAASDAHNPNSSS